LVFYSLSLLLIYNSKKFIDRKVEEKTNEYGTIETNTWLLLMKNGLKKSEIALHRLVPLKNSLNMTRNLAISREFSTFLNVAQLIHPREKGIKKNLILNLNQHFILFYINFNQLSS